MQWPSGGRFLPVAQQGLPDRLRSGRLETRGSMFLSAVGSWHRSGFAPMGHSWLTRWRPRRVTFAWADSAKDPLAISFAPDDFVSIGLLPGIDPVLRFRLTVKAFDELRWRAMFPQGTAPFHFLSCSMPTAQVWHQRGWLNATPNADPFPLLKDVHVGTPELSCQWNRNWSYLCPLGAIRSR